MAEKPLNILMCVLSTVAPDVRVEKEARYLSQKGNKVTIIAIDPKKGLPKAETRDGYKILRVQSTRKIFFKYFEYWDSVQKLVKNQFFDIIHLHDLNVLPLVSKLKDKGKFFIYDSHENFPEQMSETFGFPALWVYTLLEKHFIKKVDAVITPGETYSNNLKKKYGIESSWVCNYPSIEDVEKAHKKNIPKKFDKKGKFRIVHFGVMYHNLGYNKTVEAAEILAQNYDPTEIEFLVMGSGASFSPMKKLISSKGLEDYFILTGWMDYLEALSIMRTCDVGLVLFQPGKNNFLRMPNRLFEYCSAGVPFIGSDFEGLRIAIRGSEEIGILIDPTSPKEIAASIDMLYKDRNKLEKMKQAAREFYKSKYNWEKEAEKLLKIYKEVSENAS
ncbi:MAG: glycosyltransferase family 4 protein [Candidatus Heimdallarchaeaceae archaeon]